MAGDDDDDLGAAAVGEKLGAVDPAKELGALLDELEDLLKNGDVGTALAARNVNQSLALVAVNGIRAYLAGDKATAIEDFETVAEEVRARMTSAANVVVVDGDDGDGSDGAPN